MRVIGMDVHRSFAQVVILEDGKVVTADDGERVSEAGRKAGLAWLLPEMLTDAALEPMLFQPTGGATRQVQAQPD